MASNQFCLVPFFSLFDPRIQLLIYFVMHGFIVFYYVIYLLTPDNNSSLLYYFASIKNVGEKELSA